MKIKHIGKRQPKIRDTSKPAPKIDPHELAKRLGAEIVEDAPHFGGDPMGAIHAAHWFADRQRKARQTMASNRAGFSAGDHVRLWIKGKETSVAGRIRCFNAGPFIIDCVDGKAREFELDEIEKKMVFGRKLPSEQQPKFGRPMSKSRKRGRSSRR